MNKEEIIKRLEAIEHYAELLHSEASVLKKELEGSGVSDSSAPRGIISEERKKKILLSRKRSRAKRARDE